MRSARLPVPPGTRVRVVVLAVTAAILGAAAFLIGLLLGRPAPQPTFPPEALVVTVVNVGQGEASWIRTPDNRFIVVGSGPPGAGRKLADSLQAAGAQRIDLLILPYPYAEAVGGVPELADSLPIVQAFENGGPRVNSQQEAARQALFDRHVPVYIARAGQQFALGSGGTLTILHPADKPVQRTPAAANNSVVVRLSWGKTAFLWEGGLERAGEEALLEHPERLSADWLRVARFGTREATSPEMLGAVAPSHIVISVGANRAGLPHPETLERLVATGAQLYRTDQNAADLVFLSDGVQVSASVP